MIAMQVPFFPVSASDQATRVDLLFLGLTAISLGMCLVLFAAIWYCAVRYRAGSKADRSPLRISPLKLEIGWTVATALAFGGLFAWGTTVYLWRDSPDEKPLEIYVVGRQWMWEIRYPDGRREHNGLHVPLGRRVKLIMTSEDVIHSFYLPALRMKQDVVPGKYVSLTFVTNRPGDYRLFCAEYCGTKHSAMIGTFSVMKEAEYGNWLAGGGELPSLAERGRALFAERGCAGCHAPGSSVHAPMLEHLYGNPVPLEDGTFVTADAQYLHDSILKPLKQVVAGYEPVMPSYEGRLKETEVIELVEYIKSMDAAAPDPLNRPDPLMKKTPPSDR